MTAAPQQPAQKPVVNRPKVDDPLLTKIRKLGGINPSDPLFNDLAIQAGGRDRLKSVINKNGLQLDAMSGAVNQYLGEGERTLGTTQDLMDAIEKEIEAGRTNRKTAEKQARQFVAQEAEYYTAKARNTMAKIKAGGNDGRRSGKWRN